VVPESVMPGYPWLQERMVKGKRMQRHMRGLRAIGVPYNDADIENAPALVEGKTEMDAMIAYMQVLGTMAKLEPGVDYRQ
jgi:cytochrome c oxidase cbb3-type subunit 2